MSDAHKRAIYDSLGVKGLQTEGWEIVHRTKTPAEIRYEKLFGDVEALLTFGLIHIFFLLLLSIEFDSEEFERLARERAERKLQQRTNPKGNITINVNATEIFNPYDDEFE